MQHKPLTLKSERIQYIRENTQEVSTLYTFGPIRAKKFIVLKIQSLSNVLDHLLIII